MAKINREQFKLFTISKPWGYHPQKVEIAINEFNKEIVNLREIISGLQSQNRDLTSRNSKLEKELMNMHNQLSNLEVPTMDDAIQDMILRDYTVYNGAAPPTKKAPETQRKAPVNADLSEETLEPIPPNKSSGEIDDWDIVEI